MSKKILGQKCVLMDNKQYLNKIVTVKMDRTLDNFTGRCIAIIHRTNDNDDKLIVVPDGFNIDDETIEQQTKFQEQWFEHTIIRK